MSGRLVASKDGTKIYADATGDPSKPCIIFLHGVTSSGDVFNHLFEDKRITDEFYLVRYDLRGHGRSDTCEEDKCHFSLRYAEDFAAVMGEFSVKRPILCGWSYGSTVAVDVATNLPKDTLSAVVYVNALPYVGPIMGQCGTHVILGFLPGLYSLDDVRYSRKTILSFSDSLFTNPDAIPFSLKTSWIGMAHFQSPLAVKALLARPQDPEAFFQLGREGLPLLSISGTADKQVIGDVVAEHMSKYFTNFEYVKIENGSHALHYEQAEEFIEHLLRFCRKVVASV